MTALPKRWTRTVTRWPDEPRDEIATLDESSPGVYSVSGEIVEMFMRAAGFRPIPDDIVLDQHETITHACPPSASGITPCCERTPFELHPADRITTDPQLVTCGGAQ